jgi:hypothetical protein
MQDEINKLVEELYEKFVVRKNGKKLLCDQNALMLLIKSHTLVAMTSLVNTTIDMCERRLPIEQTKFCNSITKMQLDTMGEEHTAGFINGWNNVVKSSQSALQDLRIKE